MSAPSTPVSRASGQLTLPEDEQQAQAELKAMEAGVLYLHMRFGDPLTRTWAERELARRR